MKKRSLILAVDMSGCPNRCMHCWLGHMKNIEMDEKVDEYLVNYFKPYFDSITYYSWLREPDYCDDYEERWNKDNLVSLNSKPKRFELASFWRLVRDNNYVHFLKKIGVETVQLTFFGMEKLTDKYVGRNGAFKELIEATNILIENRIAPRWQCFINEENKKEIIDVLNLSNELELMKKCQNFNKTFELFVHSGSCDGENRKLYPIRINKESIPETLKQYVINYNDTYTEQQLCEQLCKCNETIVFSLEDTIIINVSNSMNLYFNYTHMTDKWKIGNAREDVTVIIDRIINQKVKALELTKQVTIAELVQLYGDEKSHKMFEKDDFLQYLLNEYIENN